MIRKASRFRVWSFAVILSCACCCPSIAQDKAGPQNPLEDPKQLQELLGGLLKGSGKGTGEAGGATQFEDMLRQMTEHGGGLATEGQQGNDCASQLMQRAFTAQMSNGEAFTALHEHYIATVRALIRRDWEALLKSTESGLTALEQKKTELPSDLVAMYGGELLANRGMAFGFRREGDRVENLEKSIEAFLEAGKLLPREGPCALQRAMTHSNLGAAYTQRVRGEHAENMELAVAAYEAALSITSRDAHSELWGTLQHNIGATYDSRIRGKRADNIERAKEALEAALEVRKKESVPELWAQTRNNLGNTYLKRLKGDRAENIEDAIEAFEDALTVFTREAPGGQQANTPNPLAALREQIQEDLKQAQELQPKDNGLGDLFKSIEDAVDSTMLFEELGHKPIMRVAAIDGWAVVQNGLGTAYHKRLKGDRKDNIERAIAAQQASLTLWTREEHAANWATAQSDLADAYRDRIAGDRQANLDTAVSAYRASLSVRTSHAFPRENLTTALALGQTLLAKRDWNGALGAFDTARDSFRLLFGQGLNEADARAVLQESGPLFTEAAFAAAELGDGARALALLEEGKARLLAVALKLDRLKLSTADRKRIEDLRFEIRAGEAAYQAAQGEEKAAKIAELTQRRETLLTLVDAAESAETKPAQTVRALAEAVIPEQGALAAPVVSESGGKLLVATRNAAGLNIAVATLPQLNRARLDSLLGVRSQGGWLGAYDINYLDAAEQYRRQAEWLAAIENIGAELGRLFGDELIAALKAQGLPPGRGTPLTILPVGALGLLPLGLATPPGTDRHLLEDYTLSFAPSLAALRSAKTRAEIRGREPTLVAIVNPTGDLPYTVLEGALTESRFGKRRTTAIAEQAATPEAVMAALKKHDYWHFSSHGYFDWEEPRISGLWLAGRKPLTVGALFEADALASPRLAVLSACETGLYDIGTTPNEFTGLPAAFLRLGAGGVLATLWPVNDLSTALLIARFYDFHRKDGLAPAVALRQAQSWLRTASDRHIRDYLRDADAEGRLQGSLGQSLQLALRAADRRQNLTSALRSQNPNPPSPTGSSGDEPGGEDVPFAHPYYWGGFALNGY